MARAKKPTKAKTPKKPTKDKTPVAKTPKKASKAKTPKDKTPKKPTKDKTPKKTPKAKTPKDQTVPLSRPNIISFYSDVIVSMEKKTRLYSNAAKYLDPLSSGVLVYDYATGGGLFNVMMVLEGMEGSAKSTLSNHFVASSIKNELAFSLFFDAEGTLNPELAQSIFSGYGVDLGMLDDDAGVKEKGSSPWKYYRSNIIETMFDAFKMLAKSMPDKVWIPDAKSWAYVFPKRNPHFAKAMSIYGVKPVKSLNTDNEFVCLTDFEGLEGTFFLDSFAAMVTRDADEAEVKSRIRAAEASSFSDNLRRTASLMSSKGIGFYGTNQLRTTPGVTYGDPLYAPGGSAISFYSAQRFRLTTRASGFPGQLSKRDTDSGKYAEKSVLLDGAVDLYTYKRLKSYKNKPSVQGTYAWFRTWEDDGTGQGRGICPFYDVFVYLGQTRQIVKAKSGREIVWKFRFRKSAGRSLMRLNDVEFTEMTLKTLVVGEHVGRRDLIKKAADAMGIKGAVNLREKLFEQIRTEPKIASETSMRVSQKEDEADDEDEDDDY